MAAGWHVVLAEALAGLEEAYRARLLDALSRRSPGRCPEIRRVAVYMPRVDRARTLAAFLDRERCAVHIVWSDEYVPGPRVVDEAYREIRRRKFGRTTDVETVMVDGLGGGYARLVFHTTFGEPNPYHVSVHNDASRRVRVAGTLTVFSWTWNHLMSWRPSPFVEAVYGYRVETPPLTEGTRGDAERYHG